MAFSKILAFKLINNSVFGLLANLIFLCLQIRGYFDASKVCFHGINVTFSTKIALCNCDEGYYYTQIIFSYNVFTTTNLGPRPLVARLMASKIIFLKGEDGC